MDNYDMEPWNMFTNDFMADDPDALLPDEVIAFQKQQQQLEQQQLQQQQQQQQQQQHQNPSPQQQQPHNQATSNEATAVTVKLEPLDDSTGADNDDQHQLLQSPVVEAQHNTRASSKQQRQRRQVAADEEDDDNAIFNFDVEPAPSSGRLSRPKRHQHEDERAGWQRELVARGESNDGEDDNDVEPEGEEQQLTELPMGANGSSHQSERDLQPLNINYEQAVVYICPACGAEYDAQEDWKRHINSVHQYNTRRGLNFVQIDRLYHECQECHKRIAMHAMENLLKHKFTHLPYRCTKCRYCMRQYKYRQDLMTHLRVMHRMDLTLAAEAEQQRWSRSTPQAAPSADTNSRLAIMDIKENAYDIFENTRDGAVAADGAQRRRGAVNGGGGTRRTSPALAVPAFLDDSQSGASWRSLAEGTGEGGAGGGGCDDDDETISNCVDQYATYCCPKCKMESDSEQEWRQHLASAHDYDTLEGLDFVEHAAGNSSGTVQCRLCSKLMDRNSINKLQQHKFTHLSLRWLLRCKICLTTFVSQAGLLKHLAQQHHTYPVTAEQMRRGSCDDETAYDNGHGETNGDDGAVDGLEGDDDERPFDALRFLADDTETRDDGGGGGNSFEQDPGEMEENDDDYDDDGDGEGDEEDGGGGERGAGDDWQQAPQSKQSRPRKTVDRDQYEMHTKYLCPQCGREFVEKKLWRTHITHVHQMSDLRVLNFRTIGLQQVECLECSKVITNAYGIQNAQQHRFTHLPYKSFIRCGFCNKSYTDRKGLVKHLRSVHKVAEHSTLYRKKPTWAELPSVSGWAQRQLRNSRTSSPSQDGPSPPPPPPPARQVAPPPPRPVRPPSQPPQSAIRVPPPLAPPQRMSFAAQKRAAALAVFARVRQSMASQAPATRRQDVGSSSASHCQPVKEIVRHKGFTYEIQYLEDDAACDGDDDDGHYGENHHQGGGGGDDSILSRQLRRPLRRPPPLARGEATGSRWRNGDHDEAIYRSNGFHFLEDDRPVPELGGLFGSGVAGSKSAAALNGSLNNNKWPCSDCGSMFGKQIELQRHVRDHHDDNGGVDGSDSFGGGGDLAASTTLSNRLRIKSTTPESKDTSNYADGNRRGRPDQKPRGKNGRYTSGSLAEACVEEEEVDMKVALSLSARMENDSQRFGGGDGGGADTITVATGGLDKYFCLLCPACGKEFTTQAEWRQHINNVHSFHLRDHLSFRPVDKFHLRCTVCNTNVLNTKLKTLQDHKFRHLPYKQYIRCLICGMRYNHKPNMQTHLRVRHGLIDERESIASGLASTAKGGQVGKSVAAHETNEIFGKMRGKPLPAGLKPHQDSVSFYNAVDHPTITYHCPTCNASFDTHVFWRKHIVDAHNFNSRQGLNFHQVDAHHYLCLECNRRVTVAHTKGAIGQLQSHKFRHLPFRSFHCRQCGVSFIRKQMFFKHLNKRTNSCDRRPCPPANEDDAGVGVVTNKRGLDADDDDEGAYSQPPPSKRQKYHHPAKAQHDEGVVSSAAAAAMVRPKATAVIPPPVFEEEHDSEEVSLFERHYAERSVHLPPAHTSDRGFVILCPQCGETFSGWYLWREHINSVHQFGDRANLHITKVNSRFYRCNECGERVTGNKLRDLQFHYFKHLPYVGIIKCLLCKVSYQRMRNMKSHFLRLHPEFDFKDERQAVVEAAQQEAYRYQLGEDSRTMPGDADDYDEGGDEVEEVKLVPCAVVKTDPDEVHELDAEIEATGSDGDEEVEEADDADESPEEANELDGDEETTGAVQGDDDDEDEEEENDDDEEYLLS